jgi:hypothetical protein
VLSVSALIVTDYRFYFKNVRHGYLAQLSLSFIIAGFDLCAFAKKKWIVSWGSRHCRCCFISLLIFSNKESELAKSVTERAASLTVNTTPQSAADVNTSERLKMWKKTLSMIKDHPLTGVGSGNWKVVIPSYGLANTVFAKGYFAPDRVHNTYLQITSETGIPGAIFYFGKWILIAVTRFIVIRKTNNIDKRSW